MVQLRTSLEVLVLQAWRDRWTEIEWGVALKAALVESSGEINKLCGLLIKQATLSEVPNKLVFNYLTFTVASQVVSHSSLIEAVTDYSSFHKELCIEALLDVLNFVRERLKCATVDTYHCLNMCSLLTKLFAWFTTAAENAIQRGSHNLVGELITTMMAYIYTPFISICLYFDKLENPEPFSVLQNRVKALRDSMANIDWIADSYKQDFRTFVSRLEDGGQAFSNISWNRFRDPLPQSTVISLSVLYGSVFLAEPVETLIEVLKNVREVQQLPWFQVIRDFIRGALLLQQDCSNLVPESHLTAFIYLRIPRVIQDLVQQGEMTKEQLSEALTHVSNFHALFNSLDLKTRCDGFSAFVSEFHKLHMVTDAEMTALNEIRNRDKASAVDPSPGSQASIQLVLKAEPTLQTLLKSFHSEFAKKQEKLVQMMHHMISGKSFEFICAAAAATGRLSLFAGKLIDFNEASKRSLEADEKSEDALLRGDLFDLSFLLLSRIIQLYSCSPIRQNKSARGTFFETWCSRYVDVGRRSRHSSTLSAATSSGSSDKPGDQASSSTAVDKIDPISVEECTEILQKLKANQPAWDSNPNREWHVLCESVPLIGQLLLTEIRNEQLTQEEQKSIFSGLVQINNTGGNEQREKHWVCSLLLCLAQWLVSCPVSEDRKRLAIALHAFVDASLQHGAERTKGITDKQMFMANATKRLLSPLLAPSPVSSPPYSWLNSVRRQVYTQPLGDGCLALPSIDSVRHYLSTALRQGWLGCSALLIIERCQRLNENKYWIKVCFDELAKLSAGDELNLWCDICMACCYVDPSVTLINFVEVLASFVLEARRELFCVAPRGASLSRFLVQLYLLGFRLSAKLAAGESTSAGAEEPKQKVRKIEDNQEAVSQPEPPTLRDSFMNALTNLYRRFYTICEDGDLRPAIFFVANFLRWLAEYRSPEARLMMNELPPQLIGLIIKTDPKILSAPVVLALTDMNDQKQRQRALQNLCLLRQLKAL